jgi:hypothetical protein
MTLCHGEKDPAPGVQGFNPQGEAAPGLENAVLVEGAVGGGCPSPDKAHAPVEEGVRRFFCDVHRRARNGEGYRITFSVDGVSFKQVDSFEDIPAKSGDKIYIDILPLNHTDGAIELLRRGVELYCLRRLTLIEKRREELKLPKTVRGDIKTLMSLEERWFRKLSEDLLIMRRMISAYRCMLRTHQRILNIGKATGIGFKHTIKSLEEEMGEMASKIAEEAERRVPAYNKVVEVLGIHGNQSALAALAEVLTYPEWRSWRRTRNYFGLFPRDRKTRYHRSKTARQALERLTIAVKGYRVKGRDLDEVLKTIWLTLTTQKTGPPA